MWKRTRASQLIASTYYQMPEQDYLGSFTLVDLQLNIANEGAQSKPAENLPR